MSIHTDVFVILRTFTSTTRTHNKCSHPHILHAKFGVTCCGLCVFLGNFFINIQKKHLIGNSLLSQSETSPLNRTSEQTFSFCPTNCYSFLSFATASPLHCTIIFPTCEHHFSSLARIHSLHYSHTNDYVCIRGITIAFFCTYNNHFSHSGCCTYTPILITGLQPPIHKLFIVVYYELTPLH